MKRLEIDFETLLQESDILGFVNAKLIEAGFDLNKQIWLFVDVPEMRYIYTQEESK
jgi:hypothetical protein